MVRSATAISINKKPLSATRRAPSAASLNGRSSKPPIQMENSQPLRKETPVTFDAWIQNANDNGKYFNKKHPKLTYQSKKR